MENSFKENIKLIEECNIRDDCYSASELYSMFASVGHNVLIDRSVKVFNGSKISLGSHVRIDAYSVLSAGKDGIEFGNYIHLGPYCQLNGAGGQIKLEDFCSLSSRVSIFTATDDYSDGYLTGPMVLDSFRKVRGGKITLFKHCIVGCNVVILCASSYGISLHDGCSIGAFSLVNKDIPFGFIVSGQPARKIGQRDLMLLDIMEKKFYESLGKNH